MSQVSVMISPMPVPTTSTSPTTRAITSPTEVVCSRCAGQASTPRSASARRLARSRFLQTPRQARLTIRGSSVARVPATSNSAATVTSC